MSRRGSGRRETFRSLRENGPVSLREHPSKKHEGEIMKIAKKPVVTMAPTTPVYDAIQVMVKEGFRRIPIADPGTKKLRGIITAMDIVDYLGGGSKFEIIEKRHGGNFYKAIYEPIKFIMTSDVVAIKTTGQIDEAIELMKQHNVGGLPVIDEEDKIWGIITERDITFLFAGKIGGVKVSSIMSTNVVTISPKESIFMAEKTMVERGFRRLPLVYEGKLVGIVTVMDILRFFGGGEVFHHLKSGAIMQVLQTEIEEIATKRLVTVSPEVDLGEAAKLMEENNIGALPVLENGKLVGLITERDFFKVIA
ncbi:CBS domain-containing protein [Candidatus Bathyarchaeota archaeon]|nr:MAG: CBS domain-containing protein [Candidatus Bathyarchaeota archaeon]